MPRSNSYAKRVCERLARQTRACPCSRLEPAGLAGLAPRRCPASATLKRFPPDLNRRDFPRFKDEQVSWLSFAGVAMPKSYSGEPAGTRDRSRGEHALLQAAAFDLGVQRASASFARKAM